MLPRVARWWSLMQEFSYEIDYRPGDRMSHVDALSRNPIVDDTVTSDNLLERNVMKITTEVDWVATVQSADDDVKRLRDILEQTDPSEIKHVHDNFVIKRNVLYRKTDDGDKLVIPKGTRWQILKQCHDDIGHFAYDKTLAKIKENYWFKNRKKFTRKYVESCLQCAYNKAPSGKKQGMLHSIPKVDRPFHTIHMDHLGPFVTSKTRNCYLLVIIEAFSKFIYIKPVKNTKTVTTIKVLKEYFSIFGTPERLISDQGSSFTSHQFKDFIKILNVKHILNAVATPRANGQVERYNRTILAAIASSSHGKAENQWDECVGDVQWGMNNTLNKGTGKTPAEILFGFKLVGQAEAQILNSLEQDIHIQDREGIRLDALEHMNKNQLEQQERFNKSRKKAMIYKIGDLVRVERTIQPNPNNRKDASRKLLPKFSGPYRVTAVLDHDRYQIEDTPLTKKSGAKYKNIVSVDKMMPWLSFRGNDSDSNNASEVDDDGLVDNVNDGLNQID